MDDGKMPDWKDEPDFVGNTAAMPQGELPRWLVELVQLNSGGQQREPEDVDRLLKSLKVPLVGLTLFDIGLGICALVFPKLYLKLMHPQAGELHLSATRSLLARTGLQWLFFAAVQGWAATDPVERPGWVMASGVLRLMDVPADIGYLLTDDDLGWLGKAGLVVAPLFNLGVGAVLVYAGYRGLRSGSR